MHLQYIEDSLNSLKGSETDSNERLDRKKEIEQVRCILRHATSLPWLSDETSNLDGTTALSLLSTLADGTALATWYQHKLREFLAMLEASNSGDEA